jgi:gamma-glutamyltranspeptidase/glutathione hydrolase
MLLRLFSLLAGLLLVAGCATAQHPSTTPTIVFAHGMVSAADDRAAEAGTEMLRAGGSATDAALAVLLTLNVVEPQSSGIGGGGFLLLDDGKGTIEVIDGRESAPRAATPQWFRQGDQYLTTPQAIPGGLSVGVPGNVALMEQAHSRYGKLPWKQLFGPAIRLARDGFAITARMRQFLDRARASAGLTAEGRALYFGADGEPLPVGTTVRNPALAAYLEKLAAGGPKVFYAGANAAAIARTVSASPRNPAPMTTADLAAYQAKLRAPVCAPYRAYRICGVGPPASGATTVSGVLGMLERFDLTALGRNSPVAWHLIAEAERLVYADRDRYLADSDFVSVPVAGLVSPEYLGARSQLIAPDKTLTAASAGSPPGAPLAQADTLTPDIPSTTHFVVIDRSGQAVTETSTVESSFGSGLMVSGYYLNNELTDFSLVPEREGKPVANRVEPGKRPRSSMAPTLVYGPDGKLRLAVGAAGGATIPAQVLRVIIGVIDWNLSAQDAIALPVIFAPGATVMVDKGGALEAMIPALKALGHGDVIARELPLKANAVEVVGGELRGGTDPHTEGVARSQ